MRDKKDKKDKKSSRLPVWVFVLAGLLVVGVGVAVPVVARLTSGGTESYLADAETYMQAGDVRAALIQLRNAVKQDPDDGEARLALGNAYLEAGDPRAAEAELAKAERLGIAPERISVPLAEALLEITRKRMGMTIVTDGAGAALGIFTDGDLRRVLESDADIHRVPIGEVMTAGGRRIDSDALAAEAVRRMEEHAITSLLVTDEAGQVIGVVHLHDLLRAGAA